MASYPWVFGPVIFWNNRLLIVISCGYLIDFYIIIIYFYDQIMLQELFSIISRPFIFGSSTAIFKICFISCHSLLKIPSKRLLSAWCANKKLFWGITCSPIDTSPSYMMHKSLANMIFEAITSVYILLA